MCYLQLLAIYLQTNVYEVQVFMIILVLKKDLTNPKINTRIFHICVCVTEGVTMTDIDNM